MKAMQKFYQLQNERFLAVHAEASLGLLHRAQKQFYVNSVIGSDAASNPGTDLRSPLASMDRAHTLMTASQGDVALVSPYHVENISSALTWSKAGCRFIGQSVGNLRPTLTYTAAGGNITLSGANSLFAGFNITTSGIIDVTSPLVVSGNRVLFGDIEMYESATTSQFVYGVLVSGDNCLVDNFRFLGLAGDATVTGLRMSGADGLEVRNSRIVGNFQGSVDATGAIQSLTTANLNIDIHDNRVENRDGTSEAGIVFVATDTGFVYRNFIAVPTGDFGQGIVVDDLMRQYDNYVVDVAQERGAPEGTASA